MGELVEAAKALSEPATKLIEVVSRGIGRGYDPRYKKRMADATAYEIDTIAGAIRRNGDVPILFDREGVQLDARSAQDLIERTGMRLFSQEVRKQQNIESIVDKAYEELKNEESVSNEPVDDDWIVRFFNSVEDVSNEKLQEIWGKILAGEIRRPKISSLRTLDILKNLSASEANLIERVSSCVLCNGSNVFIPNTPHLWNKIGVGFNNLFELSNIGFLNLSELKIEFDLQKSSETVYNNSIVGLFSDSSKAEKPKYKFYIYALTESGKEILKVIKRDQKRSTDFALAFFSQEKDKDSTISIQVFRILEFVDGNIRYSKTNLLI